MKKFLLLVLALLVSLTAVAMAEEALPLPVAAVPQEEGELSMTDAISAAEKAIAELPENRIVRAELMRLNDDSRAWLVSVFDQADFLNCWVVMVDAANGQVQGTDTTNIGFFSDAMNRWEQQKQVCWALWSLEDKQLFDRIYSVSPSYGQPVSGELSQGEALVKAVGALGLDNAADYEIGYAYAMGDADNDGIWMVYLVQNGECVYQVNLDARTGEVLMVEPDEEGNG